MYRLFLRKWVFLGVIILFSLIIAMKTSMVFFRFFFWFLLSVVIFSCLWVVLIFAAVKLEIKRKVANKIEVEDTLEIEAVLKNESPLPVFNFVLEDYLPFVGSPQDSQKRVLIEYIPANSSVNAKYNCLCPQRGGFTIGPFKAYFFDPLGLFFLRKIYHINSQLYVYPKTFRIKKFPSLVRGIVPWFGIETAHVSGDEDEFYGLREYREGDPLNKIHWISTAKTNKLIVKQFQRQNFFKATIIFNLEKEKDFGEGKESISEYIVKIAASIAKYLIERDISLEVIAHTKELVHIPANKGPEQLENILRFLSIASAESKICLTEIFEEFSHRIPNDSTLIVIMLDKDWEHILSMLPLEKRNISLIPILLISSTFLSSFDTKEVVRDVKIKLSEIFHVSPILILRQENLEEAFLKY